MSEQSNGEQFTSFARQGLIPPLDLFKNSWAQYQKHFNTLVPIMLVAGIGMYLQWLFLFLGPNQASTVAGKNPMAAVGTFGILSLVAAVVYLIGMIWGYTALINKINKLDQPMTLGQAFTNAKPYIWPMVITGILVTIFTLIGLVLLVIPGIIVGIWLSFALYIVIAENKKGMEAVKASKAYVDGYWWPVFGRALLMGAVVIVISIVIGGIAQMFLGPKLGTLFQNIVSLIITPWAVLYQYALYKNIRTVKG